jgi:SAM-dependent methyltransferase
MGNYWNDNYWRRHLAEPERMDIFEELWIGKHQELIDKLNKGHALDLGCGIGQNTAFWRERGFSVVSADLSETALAELKRRIPEADTVALDMTRPLPFPDG